MFPSSEEPGVFGSKVGNMSPSPPQEGRPLPPLWFFEGNFSQGQSGRAYPSATLMVTLVRCTKSAKSHQPGMRPLPREGLLGWPLSWLFPLQKKLLLSLLWAEASLFWCFLWSSVAPSWVRVRVTICRGGRGTFPHKTAWVCWRFPKGRGVGSP